MSASRPSRPSSSAPRYELHYDAMDEEWTIHRVEVIGPFASRSEARQYMIDTSEERKRAVARV